MRRTPSATALPRRRERRKDIANAVNKEDSERDHATPSIGDVHTT